MTSLFRSWAQDKDTQLERALALVGLSRALLLLPPDQSAFTPSTAAFTRHVPESVWGVLALALSLWLWAAARRPKNYANRRGAARALFAHSLVLFPLYVLSNPWATVGWYHLLLALCAAVLIFARSSDLRSSRGAEKPRSGGEDLQSRAFASDETPPSPPSLISHSSAPHPLRSPAELPCPTP